MWLRCNRKHFEWLLTRHHSSSLRTQHNALSLDQSHTTVHRCRLRIRTILFYRFAFASLARHQPYLDKHQSLSFLFRTKKIVSCKRLNRQLDEPAHTCEGPCLSFTTEHLDALMMGNLMLYKASGRFCVITSFTPLNTGTWENNSPLFKPNRTHPADRIAVHSHVRIWARLGG